MSGVQSTEELILTSPPRLSVKDEVNVGSRTRIRGTDRWNDQPGSTPRGGYVTLSSGESGESASIGPGEVLRADGGTVVTGVLFSQTTIGWGVFLIDKNKSIRESSDGIDQDVIGRGCRRVSTRSDIVDELTEESERGGSDFDLFFPIPDDHCVVKLLSNSERGKVPWLKGSLARVIIVKMYGCTHIASIVYVLRIPAGCNGGIGGKALVDRIDASKGVDIYFEV